MATDSAILARATLVVAGLVGAAGVMAAAGASHGGDVSRNLSAVATICLAHAPVLLALALAGRGRVLSIAAVLIGIGTLVFAGDLGMREWQGHGLFPGAAPLGGGSMILGWVAIIVAGAVTRDWLRFESK